MYAYIKGELVDISEDNIVLECGNIGYNIRVPLSVIQRLPSVGSTVKIYTYTSVREDAFNLFGFLSKDDLEIYKKLILVNGVGPKGALSILSTMSADDLRYAIVSGDAKAISKAPGIGSKSAERIILELRDKVALRITVPDDGSAAVVSSNPIDTDAKSEAAEAMAALGYTPVEALKAINSVEITDDMDSGSILKLALKAL